MERPLNGGMEISVIGLDGRPLCAEAAERLAAAALVAGGERHLSELSDAPERSVALKGDLSGALDEVAAEEGPVVVLASGDPGFFGIVRLLSGRFGGDRLRVYPALSSVALAFGRAGLSWEDAVVASAHGAPRDTHRDPRRAVNLCRANPKVAVLTRPGFGPAELARELCCGPAGVRKEFLVCERLGMADERVFQGSAEEVIREEWRDPNVVLVLDEGYSAGGESGSKARVSGGLRAPGRWALPESEFEYRSAMISKSEVRALVLSRLGPGPGDLVWDVGAGSGSVAIECARFGSAAIAVERESESCDRIRRNSAHHGTRVAVIEGEAPAALDGLPQPDTVFIGGTGSVPGGFEATVRAAARRALRSVVLSLVTLERVVPASKLLEEAGFAVETTFLQSSRLKGVGSLNRLAPESPVFIVSGERS